MIGEIEMKKMIPLLIGLLLAGVAAYFFLRKKDAAVQTTSSDLNLNSSKLLDLNSTDSVIDNLSLTSDLNKKAKNWVKTIKNAISSGSNGWSKNSQQKKARDNGFTYSQQLVMSALWQMYETSSYITLDDYYKYESELESLNQ